MGQEFGGGAGEDDPGQVSGECRTDRDCARSTVCVRGGGACSAAGADGECSQEQAQGPCSIQDGVQGRQEAGADTFCGPALLLYPERVSRLCSQSQALCWHSLDPPPHLGVHRFIGVVLTMDACTFYWLTLAAGRSSLACVLADARSHASSLTLARTHARPLTGRPWLVGPTRPH